LSIDRTPLPWSFACSARHGHVAAVFDHGGPIAEWDVETGDEGGSITACWTADGKTLALMERRWTLRFSGLIRLSDGEEVNVTVKRLP
jgi:hypothetical protein